MKQIDWYLDFISPFAYLASRSLQKLPDGCDITPHPILFAGLLKHWETKGPAEIPAMKQFTFRHISWIAQRENIPITMPPMHPFNPLKLLRLCIALDSSDAIVERLFRFVWEDGHSSDNPDQWHALGDELGLVDIDASVSDATVKGKLLENTNNAIAHNVFGVPAFIVDGEHFWGFDSIDFLCGYLADPELFSSELMRSVDAMPAGVTRH
ncbi:MAG: 2-hydroxychromene-2-carboxylate isomerase [Pseudomonadota bacterium]